MADKAPAEPLRFVYIFRFPDGSDKRFEVCLDPSTLALIPPASSAKPEWTKLSYQQCDQCPLEGKVDSCPVAVNLSGLVEQFQDTLSFEQATVTVETAQRTVSRSTTVQQGLSSIIGMYMVTSNCPAMDALRPNVRFHLPFASTEETIYRAISMYLTAQYFRMRRGEAPDWELKHLAEIYKSVWRVNKGMTRRLAQASSKDANVNAVIVLSTFGSTLDDYLEESLSEIAPLFAPPPAGKG